MSAVSACPETQDTSTDPGEPWTVTTAPRRWVWVEASEIWRFRELLYFLAWRDVKVRYKQTAFGAGWAILQPVLTMAVFTVVFGHFVGVPSDGIPYAAFAFAALVPWMFFSSTLLRAGNSLVGNSNLISKVYFPRIIMPVAAAGAGLVDLLLALATLSVLLIALRVSLSSAVVALPLFVILAAVTAVGAGVWLSALSVRYRDVANVMPFLTQLWLYATPIAYPASLIHGKLHIVFALNPMTGVVEGFRWSLLGTRPLDLQALVVSSLVAVCVLTSAIFYFQRVEQHFADVV